MWVTPHGCEEIRGKPETQTAATTVRLPITQPHMRNRQDHRDCDSKEGSDELAFTKSGEPWSGAAVLRLILQQTDISGVPGFSGDSDHFSRGQNHHPFFANWGEFVWGGQL